MKRILALALALCLSLAAAGAAADAVRYIDRSAGEAKTAEAIVFTSSYHWRDWGNGDSGEAWYAISGEVTFTERINANGNIHLILCDGAVLNAKNGIELGSGSSLTIYGYLENTGKLVAEGYLYDAYTTQTVYPGIGSLYNCGDVTIHGGTVQAVGSFGSAGIGGGLKPGASVAGGVNGSGGNVTILGGNVTATSYQLERRGPAIGGGEFEGDPGTLTIAPGKNATITVKAGEHPNFNNSVVKYETNTQITGFGEWLYFHSEATINPPDQDIIDPPQNPGGGDDNPPQDPDGDAQDAAAALPRTGDPSMLLGWAALLGAAGAGLRICRRK